MIVCICNALKECQVRQAARDGAACPTSAYRTLGRKPRCGQCSLEDLCYSPDKTV